jgi:hypothetical protein
MIDFYQHDLAMVRISPDDALFLQVFEDVNTSQTPIPDAMRKSWQRRYDRLMADIGKVAHWKAQNA